MNITFDKKMTQGWSTWTLTDDRITIKERIFFSKQTTVIFLSDITELARIEEGELGFITLYFKSPDMQNDSKIISYRKSVRNEANKAIEYIFSVSHCKDVTERKKEEKKKFFADKRKRCEVCGHIFCYTYADTQRNFRLQDEAEKLRKQGELEWWCSSVSAGNINKKRAEDLEAQIVDYSKCPKCGSRALVDVTDEELANNQNAQQTSPADELKKYKELLDMGAITQEEFDAKKKQLLGL